MLEHDEEQTLAEIEARLRLEAPELQRLLEAEMGEIEGLLAVDANRHPTRHSRSRAWASAAAAFTFAFAAITLTTLTFGPDVGGLVGAIALTVASTYSYQMIRGCPGLY